ncbi:uncharacterized protein LOC134257201 [Saccostrea cucullata]|uniref:uncharacterized protein LOC134257201 n=1 Tax=Saccostrea cuccullata TaxID=36930 RepID=UPI002ED26C77
MSFTMQSYFKYLFSIHTSEHEVKTSPSVYERVIIKHISVTSVSQGEVCNDISNLGMERYHVAVKQGHAVSAMVTCPTSIQGIFSYTYTGLACTDTLLDTCTNKTMFIYNDTLCNDNPMFSSEGTLHCAFTGIEGSDTFVTLYNADSSVTNPTSFQFSCMVYTTSGSTVSATINPEECITGQTSTSLSSTYGKTVTYTALSSCSTPEPEESEDDFTWLYILLAVFVLLVLILVIFVLIKSSFKKKEQVLPNKTEDVIISKPPIRHIFT